MLKNCNAVALLVLALGGVHADELLLKEKVSSLFKSAVKKASRGIIVRQDANTDNNLDEFGIGGLFDQFGIDSFICSNPTAFTNFNLASLEGNWYQTYASRSTDVYGCLNYQIVADPDENIGSTKAVNLNTSWTAFNTYWNPW